MKSITFLITAVLLSASFSFAQEAQESQDDCGTYTAGKKAYEELESFTNLKGDLQNSFMNRTIIVQAGMIGKQADMTTNAKKKAILKRQAQHLCDTRD